MGDLTGWPYWKVISITGQSGAGTDYQVELEIGDSAGGNFHLEGHCTNFPQDIQITDDDGTTLLDHWVEDITADPIVVHVKVDDDLGSNQDIRVYYGKSGETTASNGGNTFIEYDGFEDGDTTDAGDFFITSSNYASSSQSHNGTYSALFPNTDPDDVIKCISLGSLPLGSHVFSMWIYFPSTTGRRTTIGILENGGIWTTGTGAIIKFDGGNILSYNGSAYIDTTLNFTTGWHKIDIIQYASTHDIRINSGSWITGLDNRNTISNIDKIGNVYTTLDTGLEYFDDYTISKYNSPEPAFNSAGAEQTPPPVGAIMNQFQTANIGADLYNGVFA